MNFSSYSPSSTETQPSAIVTNLKDLSAKKPQEKNWGNRKKENEFKLHLPNWKSLKSIVNWKSVILIIISLGKLFHGNRFWFQAASFISLDGWLQIPPPQWRMQKKKENKDRRTNVLIKNWWMKWKCASRKLSLIIGNGSPKGYQTNILP